jgi:hypothetical protein
MRLISSLQGDAPNLLSQEKQYSGIAQQGDSAETRK